METKKVGTDAAELFCSVPFTTERLRGFPYKSFVCRCRYCRYCSKGKCSLKECCCMEERIRAHTCSCGEMMAYGFSEIRDPAFRYRLRLAGERITQSRSCFLDAGHRKRYYEGLILAKRASNNLKAQIFMMSAYVTVWDSAKILLSPMGFPYAVLEASATEFDVNAYHLFLAALNLQYGAVSSDLPDLSDEESVDFDVFRTIAFAAVMNAYGSDAVKISEKSNGQHPKRKRREVRDHE